MTTRSTLRQSIRDELNDNASTKIWTDALLNTYIVEAIRAYSRELPQEVSSSLAAVADQPNYALPARFSRFTRVEYPDGFIRTYSTQAGGASAVSTTDVDPGYRVFGGELLLDPAPAASGSIWIEYLAGYAEPAADGDTIQTPATDDDVLIRLACAMALQWISTDEAKRQRFERTRGASAMSMASAYDQDARRAINLRKRRVRASRLVAASPADAGVVLESTDPGP